MRGAYMVCVSRSISVSWENSSTSTISYFFVVALLPYLSMILILALFWPPFSGERGKMHTHTHITITVTVSFLPQFWSEHNVYLYFAPRFFRAVDFFARARSGPQSVFFFLAYGETYCLMRYGVHLRFDEEKMYFTRLSVEFHF